MRSVLNLLIRSCVERYGDPLLEDIVIWTACTSYDAEATKVEVLAMVNRGELRMKDDVIDHDWTYRRGHNWDNEPKEKPNEVGSVE